MKAGAAAAADGWLRLIRADGPAIPRAVALLNLALSVAVFFGIFHAHLNSGDEYAYLVSAEILARGRLSVPSPALKEFFDVVHVVNDGRFYGKYPPGWPLLLAVGVLAGMPWLVNPLIGAATVFAIHRLARRHFSTEVANIASLCLAGNPFFVFNSASYFSHSACLLFTVLAVGALFDAEERPAGIGSWFAAGAAAGAAFLIRPFTAVVVLSVPALFVLARLRGSGVTTASRGLAASGASFGLFAALFLAYNALQTGDPFVQPFEMYAPWDAPSLPKDAKELEARVSSHVLRRTWDLGLWLPLSPAFALLALAYPDLRRDPRLRVLLLSAAALFIAFFFYWGDGIIQYGPRYLYEAVGGLAVASAAVIRRFGRTGLAMVAGVLLLNGVVFVRAGAEVSDEIRRKRNVFDLAEEAGLSNAVVFLRTGSGPAPVWDCPRNGIDFDGPVLYVRDRGDDNARLLERYPGRTAYYYEYVASRKQGYLTPMPREGAGP